MAQIANRHVFIVGGTGSGKTTAEVKELVEEADRNDSAIVCIDPHAASLGASFFAHLCERGHQDRVLYDRLLDIDRVLKWDFLSPSKATSSRERHAENQTRCERFAEILLRRRGKESAADTPGIEEWLLAALNLYIFQRKRLPLADIRYAFSFAHPKFKAMLNGCEDADTRFKFEEIIDSHQTPYKAAERLIMGVCRSVAFQVRTEHASGFNFDRHLSQKGILIVEGGEGGALSPDAMRTMLGAIILKTLSYVRDRKTEYPHVTVALDEANNANLIGEAGHEIRALAELRKYGLGMHVLVQLLDFSSTRIERGVLANCATRKYFNCSEPMTAIRLGADLGGSYDTQEAKTRYYKDGSSWDAPLTVANPYSNELRKLPVGECYVRRGAHTSRERITPLKDPFGVPETVLAAMMSGYVNAIQERCEYYSPTDSDEQSPMNDFSTPSDNKAVDGGPFGI